MYLFLCIVFYTCVYLSSIVLYVYLILCILMLQNMRHMKESEYIDELHVVLVITYANIIEPQG